MNRIDITIEHLCDVCAFTHKCIRHKAIMTALQTVEENSLEKWHLDIDTNFVVKNCSLFRPDSDKVIEYLNEINLEE